MKGLKTKLYRTALTKNHNLFSAIRAGLWFEGRRMAFINSINYHYTRILEEAGSLGLSPLDEVHAVLIERKSHSFHAYPIQTMPLWEAVCEKIEREGISSGTNTFWMQIEIWRIGDQMPESVAELIW